MHQYLTAIVMLFSILAHTLMGCGWHHAHDCHGGQQSSCQPVAVCTHSEHAHTEHAHHHNHKDGHHRSNAVTEELPVNSESNPCEEGRCSYLSPTSVKVHEVTTQLEDLLPPLDLLYSSLEKQYSQTMLEINSASSITALGVRAQAQTAVWLI